MDNYYRKQAAQLIDKMQSTFPKLDAKLIQKWHDLMQDMYGRDQAAKNTFCTEHVPKGIMRYLANS